MRILGVTLAVAILSCWIADRAKAEKPDQGDRKEKLLEKFDANGNGQLDPEEKEKARAEFAKRRAAGKGPADKGPDGKGPKGKGRPGGEGRPSREEMLKKFDKNNDGKLDETERQAARAEFAKRRGGADGKGRPGGKGRPSREEIMKKFDKDGDGKLNEAERKAAHEAMRNRRGAKGGPGGKGGAGGEGRPSREEMMKKFDKNGDGQLDEGERKTLHEAIQKRRGGQRPQGKGGPEGRRGPGRKGPPGKGGSGKPKGKPSK